MDEAIHVLEQEPPGRELVRVYARKATELLTGDRNEETLIWSEKALKLARELGMPDEEARALQARGAARCEMGDEGGLDDLREAIRMSEAAGLSEALALSQANYAFQLWFRDGPTAAQEVWRESERVAEARGFQSLVQMARLGQLETLFDMGRWDEVLTLAQSIKGWLKPRDQGTEAAVYATIFEGWVHLRRGEIEDLGDLAEELLVRAIPFEASEYVAPAALLAAEYRRITGDGAGAREAMRTFLEVTQGSPNFRALFVPVAVRSLVALGDVDAAEAVIPATSDARTARHRVSLLTAHAIVAEARGRCEDALEGYREAIELWRSHGFRLELGLTLTGAARCLLELEREEEAEPMLLEAREVLAPLRAGPSVTEVEAMLNAEAAELG